MRSAADPKEPLLLLLLAELGDQTAAEDLDTYRHKIYMYYTAYKKSKKYKDWRDKSDDTERKSTVGNRKMLAIKPDFIDDFLDTYRTDTIGKFMYQAAQEQVDETARRQSAVARFKLSELYNKIKQEQTETCS